MRGINSFEFFHLGKVLEQLTNIKEGDDVVEFYLSLNRCESALEKLLSGEFFDLVYCRPEAQGLLDQIRRALKSHFQNEDGEFLFNPEWEGKVPQIAIWQFSETIQKMETNLAAELREASTFYIQGRAIYDTKKLVDDASKSIPESLLEILNEMAKDDLGNSGRCLAFGLPTASGFHAVRAVEGVLGDYARAFDDGPAATKAKTMGDSVQALMALHKVNDHKGPLPNKKTLRALDQIRDLDRNPVVHPRENLSEEEALALFSLANSAIIYMLNEMNELDFSPEQRSLELITAAANDETEKAAG